MSKRILTVLMFLALQLCSGCGGGSKPNDTNEPNDNNPPATGGGNAVLPFTDLSYPELVKVDDNELFDVTPTYKGNIKNFSISPAITLQGIGFDTKSGRLFGAALQAGLDQTFTITASNDEYKKTAELRLLVTSNGDVVVQPPLISVQLLPPDLTLVVGNTATAAAPFAISVVAGNIATKFGVSPTLPAGLELDDVNGVIYGSVTTPQAQATYTLTAENNNSSVSTDFTIAIQAANQPITGFEYEPKEFHGEVGEYFVLLPEVIGGPAVNYQLAASSQALPAGTQLMQQGVISGVISQPLVATSYTIEAFASDGTKKSATIILEAQSPTEPPAPIKSFVYNPNSATLDVGESLNMVPMTTGGTPTLYQLVQGNLPAGIALDSATGIISGVATAATAGPVAVQVKASNLASATITAGVTIEVNELEPPTNGVFTYLGQTTGSKKKLILKVNKEYDLAPQGIDAGLTIIDCELMKGSLAGLKLTKACKIKDETSVIKQSDVKIKGTANDGSKWVNEFTLYTTDTKPITAFGYPELTYVLEQGTFFSTDAAMLGGKATNCSSSPKLPNGLKFNEETCRIFGTPTEVSGKTAYFITATNPWGGMTADPIFIKVKAPVPVPCEGNSLISINSLTIGEFQALFATCADSSSYDPQMMPTYKNAAGLLKQDYRFFFSSTEKCETARDAILAAVVTYACDATIQVNGGVIQDTNTNIYEVFNASVNTELN